MNAVNIVALLLPSISKKVRSAGNKAMAEINERGVLRSTITQESCIKAYSVVLEEELDLLYKKIPKIKFKTSEIRNLQVKLGEFIKGEFSYLINDLEKRALIYNDPKEMVEEKITQLSASIEFETQALIKHKRDKWWGVFWEISKLVVAAILGASLKIIFDRFFLG